MQLEKVTWPLRSKLAVVNAAGREHKTHLD
jgi:hypothetical protein